MLQQLRVSEDGRFLVREDGDAFFYLGDTAWELFHRLSREDADHYLTDRAEKGFTVIQAVALAEHGFDKPNAYGHHPLIDLNPDRPNEDYFKHVDWVVDRANDLGMYVALLPTWGDKWNKSSWGAGPELFTTNNAFAYGQFLGRRYKSHGVIWVVGGDRAVETPQHTEIIRSMAKGLSAGDSGAHLRTFHPMGQQTSSQYFHNDPWLDFNMYQTGHTRDQENWKQISADYNLSPAKPCLDAEPGYEDHPSGFDARNGYLDAYDVRKSAYWSVFAGACGHTYGCHDIWQFLDTERFSAVTTPRTPWKEALKLPGSEHMQHLRKLAESRPFLKLIPDQTLIVSEPGNGPHHVQAARASDGSYAYVYVPVSQDIAVNTSKLCGDTVTAAWYDPRRGETHSSFPVPKEDSFTFSSPTPGMWQDWVLVLDSQ